MKTPSNNMSAKGLQLYSNTEGVEYENRYPYRQWHLVCCDILFSVWSISQIARFMGPTWGPPDRVLSAPGGAHVSHINLAIRDVCIQECQRSMQLHGGVSYCVLRCELTTSVDFPYFSCCKMDPRQTHDSDSRRKQPRKRYLVQFLQQINAAKVRLVR